MQAGRQAGVKYERMEVKAQRNRFRPVEIIMSSLGHSQAVERSCFFFYGEERKDRLRTNEWTLNDDSNDL